MPKDKLTEEKARKLAEDFFGDIQYGDQRDKPKWREAVIGGATAIIIEFATNAQAHERKRVVKELIEVIKNSRTISERFGVGKKEETTRSQVVADIVTKYLQNNE